MVIKHEAIKKCCFYIDFDNIRSYPGSGSTIYDLSYKGCYPTGIINGTPTIDSGYISFNGTTGQYIECTNIINIDREIMIGFWVKPNTITINLPNTYNGGENPPAIGTQNWIVYPDYSINYTTIGISIGTNGIVVCERGNNTYIASLLSYSGTISSTLFTHVMLKFVKSGNVYYPILYLNGVEIATGINSFSTSYSLDILLIGGGFKNNYGSYFSGNIAMFYIFNKGITNLIMQCLYASHKYRF